MTEIHNPQDLFFKEVFSRPEAAAEFFAAFLPKEIVALLDLSKLEPIKDSFIISIAARTPVGFDLSRSSQERQPGLYLRPDRTQERPR
jgi:hypothetical protein